MVSTDGERPARASKTASREASRGLAAEEASTTASRTLTKASLSRFTSPALSAKANTPGVDESAPSEPRTRLPSTSSQVSSKEPPVPVSSSYGTRSRNRRGGDRPNYAEDTEMDFEMANQATARPRDPSLSSSDDEPLSPVPFGLPQSPPPAPAPAPAPPKRVPATNGWTALNKEASVPSISAVTAASTVPAPSRKRKAAAIASQNIAAGNPSIPAAAQTGSKKGGMASLPTPPSRETNMVTFENCNTTLNKDGHLVSDEGVVYAPNDHIYLICEPPGDPYYIGRIMEFRCQVPEDTTTPVEFIRINWVYRPRDVQRFVNDSRLVYVTMHSDLSPLTSLRGKLQLKHRSEISDIDAYRKIPDSFWYNQCFDRFIHRWYEVIPTSTVTNVPRNVKKTLDKRWKFLVVEASRVKDLTSEVKLCAKCDGYCAADDSVDCAICKHTFHLTCVRPALARKPARGFAWACAVCSRAAEKKREARRTSLVGENETDAEEEEIAEEEEEDPAILAERAARAKAEAATENITSEAEIAHAKMWSYRYLGIHCRVEDALQYEDRAIYPRASSRLGPKHQANAPEWYGRPVQLVKPLEIKKKYMKTGTKKGQEKITKETQQAIEADRAAKANRPKWVQDEPQGYVRRGEDLPNDDPNCTALLAFKLPPAIPSTRGEDDVSTPPEDLVDAYMIRAKAIAKDIGVEAYSTDFLDRAVFLLQQNAFDQDAALRQLKKTKKVGDWPKARWQTRKDLRDPRFTLKDDEKKRFETAVARHGSELRLVRQYVRTISHADTVRYWYYWKKTPRGKQIWGSYEGRKSGSKIKKVNTKETATKLLDDVADDEDDSAFDSVKVYSKGRKMSCKFCNTKRSRFWRRAPNVAPGQMQAADGRSKDKGSSFMVALCSRCARLWRKYAIQWEDQDETNKKISQGGGRAWKRRVDEELIKEWSIAENAPPEGPDDYELMFAAQAAAEPPKKKQKGGNDGIATPPQVEAPKKKPLPPPPPPPPPKEPTPPPIPAQPKMRVLPCGVCDTIEPTETMLSCRDCRLAVHRNCYGVTGPRSNNKWGCDPCANDRSAMSNSADPAAYSYECVLCPVRYTDQTLVEPPKVSHKKKTDREREKERQEKELCEDLERQYTKSQEQRGKPIRPREALKRTADNKWVHVSCAVWTPEIRFSNPATLEVAEGIPLIPRARREQICKLCKTAQGACVACHHCNANFHIACAYQQGYSFGFDITPVKASRRDAVTTVTVGAETGFMTAAIWCKEHASSTIKTAVHYLNEVVDDSGKTALQLFAENYKQADLTLTGTARKANYLDEITKSHAPAVQPVTNNTNRRVSTAASVTGARTARNSSAGLTQPKEEPRDSDTRLSTPQKDKPIRRCATCDADVSPKWWKHIDKVKPASEPVAPVSTDIPISNGLGHDVLPSRESPVQIDSPSLSNGHPVESGENFAGFGMLVPEPKAVTPSVPVHEVSVDAVPVVYDCNKCHWKLLEGPKEVEQPEPETEATPPIVEHTMSPPRRHQTEHLWGSAHLPMQQHPLPLEYPPHQHTQNWRYQNGLPPNGLPNGLSNGASHSPPPVPMRTGFGGRSPPPAAVMDHRHYPAVPTYVTTNAQGMPPRAAYASASPSLVPGLSNGLSSQSMRSPTLSGSSMHGLHRQSDSPYNGGPPARQSGSYSYMNRSPTQAIAAPRPSAPRDMPPLPAAPRGVHGASASPSVHNILND
ncbi:hypothetical protein E6O75_ATG11644 [Venturia nashicola]|uniref:Uncharacterized protein n=1 Tax=Venturia nashicola TaxID=86259 RepID=A0A4Z1NL24_9PEZI|nr:hypothetical protein E6O75_ATG11644 [Venturia nashicola]